MGYDCSVTKRKGCNYCSRRKRILNDSCGFTIVVDDESKQLYISSIDGCQCAEIKVKIMYCPICGKEF